MEAAIVIQPALSSAPRAAEVEATREPPAIRVGIAPADAQATVRLGTDATRKEAARRLRLVDAFRAWLAAHSGPGRSPRSAAAAFLATGARVDGLSRPSAQTLEYWLLAHDRDGFPGLIPRRERRGWRKPWPEAAKRRLEALWLQPNRPSCAQAIKRLRFFAREKGWDLPSDRTMRRHLCAIRRPVQVRLREGKAAFEVGCLPHIERSYEDLAINDVWTGDHCQLDVMVRGADGSTFRPWITGWLDCKSRSLVGSVLVQTPSSDSIIAAFIRGARAFGLPGASYCDNGRDYSGKALAGMVRRWRHRAFKRTKDHTEMTGLYGTLGVQAIFAIPKNARAKIIERFFRTMKEAFEKWLLRGYVGNCPAARPEGTAAAIRRGDLLTFEEVEHLWHRWVEEVYHRMPHGGRGMKGRTPNQVWNAGLDAGVVVRKASPGALAVLLARRREVQVRQQGVRVEERDFWCVELPRLAPQGDRVVVRYDPGDLSAVSVFDLQDNYLCEAPVQRPSFFLDPEAPHAGRARAKEVRDVFAPEIQRIIEEQRQLNQEDLLFNVPTVPEERRSAPTIRPVPTVFDAPARRILEGAADRKAERRQEEEESRRRMIAAGERLAALPPPPPSLQDQAMKKVVEVTEGWK